MLPSLIIFDINHAYHNYFLSDSATIYAAKTFLKISMPIYPCMHFFNIYSILGRLKPFLCCKPCNNGKYNLLSLKYNMYSMARQMQQ